MGISNSSFLDHHALALVAVELVLVTIIQGHTKGPKFDKRHQCDSDDGHFSDADRDNISGVDRCALISHI